MSIDSENKSSVIQSGSENVNNGSPGVINNHYSDTLFSFFVFLIFFIFVILVGKLHNRMIKALEFIVSVAWYKRLTVFFIGVLSTYISTQVPQPLFSIPIIVGYITTFAFNEFSLKKDIEKSKNPLEEEISKKEKEIELFRRIIEEKKNTFNIIVIKRINSCLRVKGKTDSEILKKITQKVEELQDIILAEKTFMETPDEALRRYNNSTSGDSILASQTLVENTPMVPTTSN